MSSLLDLPNELIINILSDVTISPTEIYIVSCLSKRLNALALPIYLAAQGIPEPEKEISLYVLHWDNHRIQYLSPFPGSGINVFTPDTLSGLNISSISQVKHFKCFFQDPTKEQRNPFQRAYDLSMAVKRTARFIHRLRHVDTAEIYLVWDPYYVRSYNTVNYLSIPELNEWTESFSRLLNFIVERGCTSLTVQYDAAIEIPFRFRSSNPITKTFSNVFQHVQKRHGKQAPTLQWQLERPNEGKLDPPIVAAPLARGFNTIVTLSIHSNILLLPPFVNWTLSLLYNNSNLTCITFAHLTFAGEIWTTILPPIADAVSDRLTELSILSQCTNLTTENLIRFLARLPHLTHLSIDRIFCSRLQLTRPGGNLQTSNLTLPHLPRLQVLQAPTNLVSLLFNAQPPSSPSGKNGTTPTGFPHLRSLTVYPCSQLHHPADYSKSTSNINSLIRQIKNQSRGHEVEYALNLQMEFTSFTHIIHYLQSQTPEQKYYDSLLDETNGVEVEQRQRSSRIIFHDITRVVLYRLMPLHNPTSLCLWLKLLFPHLETLVFTCRIPSQPEHVSLLDASVVEQLIKELPTTCPTVQILVVADKTYKLGGN